jgi:hypothetical protein
MRTSTAFMPVRTEAAHLQVDVSRWPVVQLTCVGRASDHQWAGHLREIEEKVLARREPFVHVIDQTRGELPDPVQRSLIVRHQLRMEPRYRAYCRGEVYVATPEMQQVMCTVFSQAKPPYPYTFVESLDEAARWAETRLG